MAMLQFQPVSLDPVLPIRECQNKRRRARDWETMCICRAWEPSHGHVAISTCLSWPCDPDMRNCKMQARRVGNNVYLQGLETLPWPCYNFNLFLLTPSCLYPYAKTTDAGRGIGKQCVSAGHGNLPMAMLQFRPVYLDPAMPRRVCQTVRCRV